MKTPGKLYPPPAQAIFNRLPLAKFCQTCAGVFYRLHGMCPKTQEPWPPIYFSRRGRTRFDPKGGLGTMYLGESLAGVLMELFDDMWGPVNTNTRSLTQTQLREWYVTLVAVPKISVFNAQGLNLSGIGTDGQLLTGEHLFSRKWANQLARHPAKIDGIYFPSRHHNGKFNLALFRQRNWLLEFDPQLQSLATVLNRRTNVSPDALVCGPTILLKEHSELLDALVELQVAELP